MIVYTVLFISFDFRFLYKSEFQLPILEIPLNFFIVSGPTFPVLSITHTARFYLVKEMDKRNLCLKGNFCHASTLIRRDFCYASTLIWRDFLMLMFSSKCLLFCFSLFVNEVLFVK